MASAVEHLERAIDFCDRALSQLKALDQPLGENGVHDVIPLVEAARTEVVATLNGRELAAEPVDLADRLDEQPAG